MKRNTNRKILCFCSGLTGDAKRRARSKFRTSLPTTDDWRNLIDNSISRHDPSLVPASLENDECKRTPFFVLRDKAMLVLVVRRLLAGDARARLTLEHLTRYHPDLPQALVLVRLQNIFFHSKYFET